MDSAERMRPTGPCGEDDDAVSAGDAEAIGGGNVTGADADGWREGATSGEDEGEFSAGGFGGEGEETAF